MQQLGIIRNPLTVKDYISSIFRTLQYFFYEMYSEDLTLEDFGPRFVKYHISIEE